MNSGFENGLSGWKVEGDVRVSSSSGKHVLVFGAGKGAVRQTYRAPGLRILFFGAQLSGPGLVRLECVDRHGHVLMNLTGGPDAKGGAGIYLKTHAFTDHVVLSIEKGAAGVLKAEDVSFTDDDRDRVEHAPQMDLAEAMRPIWLGNRVTNESVLLLSRHGGVASGRLMFTPRSVIAVRDSSLGTLYVEGKDYTVSGRVISAVAGSGIPVMSDNEFEKGEFPWTRLDGRHVFVTYEHGDAWAGPTPGYAGDLLPLTMQRLRGRKPLTVVAYGDSITLGINVSGYRKVPPYQPVWPSLVVSELSRVYGHKGIRLYNAGLGGMTSQWALDNAKDAVASLDPDLVLIAFGMNDFWSLTPALFKANIEKTMFLIRERRPKCEFILVAPMKFDPAYTADPTYVGNLAGYAGVLRELVGPSVALFDMTALSEALYGLKSCKDLATDPMHPDDFLARWYAQGVAQMLLPAAR